MPILRLLALGADPPTSEIIICGRGSSGAKASIASQTIAPLELFADGSVADDDVGLALIVNEESGGRGMDQLSAVLTERNTRPSVAIFGEPTNGTLSWGHREPLACTVTVKGKSGESGYPWSGKSANEVLIRGLLKAIDADLGSSDLYGNITTNVGEMAGGVAANVIPDAVNASLAIRVAIGPQDSGHLIVKDRLEKI